MHSLDNLTKNELLELVRTLEHRLEQSGADLVPATQPRPLELDFVCAQTLQALDQSAIPAFIYAIGADSARRIADAGTDKPGGEFKLLAANRSMGAVTGYAPEELVGRGLMSLLDHDEREGVRRLLNRPRRRGFSSFGGWRHRTRSGEIREVEASGYDLEFRGRRARFVIVQDVTRRQREALMQQRLASIVENSHDAIVSTTVDGRVLSWNQAAERLFGYGAAEMVGRSIDRLLPPEMADQEKASIRPRIMAGEQVDSRETVRLRKSGERIDVSMSVAPLRGAAGAIVGISSITRDITEKKTHEQRLRLLSAIVGTTDDAIMSWSADGTLLSWNEGAEAILGYSAEEILGNSVSVLMPPGDADWKELTRAVAAGEKVLNQGTVRRHRNGTMIQVAVTCSPMRDESGQVTAVSCIARDIRHQKLQERLVAEGHRRLKLALETAGLSLWDWDIAASRVHHDDAFARLLGYAPGELPHSSRLWEGLIHPDDAPRVAEHIECHLAGRCELFELEFRVRSRDAEWLWVGARGRVVGRDRTGAPLRMMGTCQDISGRKRAEQTSQMLAAFLDSSDDSIVSRTLDGTILSWNRGAERILGYGAAEIVGSSHLVLIPPERRDETARVTELVRTGETVCDLETVRRHRDGHEVHLALTVAPLRDPEGRVIGAASIGRDITKRIRADSARGLLAAVVESSQDAIISHGLDGTILSWNHGAEEIFGYTASEVIGHNYHLLVPGEFPSQMRERCVRIERGDRVAPFETAARRKDGSSVLVSVSVAALRDQAGRIAGVAAVARDISTQKRLELLMERTQAIGHVGGWEVDGRSGRLFWTDETYRIHDLSPGRYVPTVDSAVGFYAQEAVPTIHRAMQRAMELGEPFDAELPLITARGRSVWVRVIGEAQREDGQVTHVYGTLQDITSRRQAEDALRERERQLESILDNAAEGMIVLSAAGGIERFNRQAQHMFGYSTQEVRGLHLKQITIELGYEDQGGAGAEAAANWMQRLVGSHREVTGRRQDGSIFPLELAVSEIVMSPGPNQFTAIVRDITDRKSWENRIYSLAYSDSLTGLPNRLLLRDRLEHAIAAAQRNRTLVGVLFFDIDHFKPINDSYGHHVGDLLLREIAERARSCVREIDTVSRLGGDEFVVVLPELREALDAAAVARKILAAMGQAYRIDGHEFSITQTLGISIYPQDGPDADALLRNADSAMYHAKESGKNCFLFFNPGAL